MVFLMVVYVTLPLFRALSHVFSNASLLYLWEKLRTPWHILYVWTSNFLDFRIRLITSVVLGPIVIALRIKYAEFHSAMSLKLAGR